MKKLFALVLSLCLLGSFALAEENAITWDQVAPAVEASGVEGDFVTLDQLGLKLWIPAGLLETEFSEEDAAAGRLALYMAEDQSGYLVIDAVHVDDMTLDQAVENTKATGMKDVEVVNTNGLTGVSYVNEAADTYSLSLVDTNSNIINFSMGPVSSDPENVKTVFSFIMASLQPAE
ncbi:MAG: hypothetical protein J5865_08450 [Lachnospiraceae bacterium]|nr:hypothetical protein [Lachnospiraceae bacterium]